VRTAPALLLLFLPVIGSSQAIDNTLRHDGGNYFSMVYENDVFNHTDQYYTQGILAEYSRRVSTKFFKESIATSMGLSVAHEVYTPTSILSDSILYGDRPFSACLMASAFMNLYDSVDRQRLMYSITAGVIGPVAGGEEMQTTIHRNIGSAIPHGWQYQLHNDALINIQAEYEKQLLHLRALNIAAIASGRVGTLQTGAAAGLFVKVGLFSNKRSFRLYLYTQPLAHIVGYEATLQGGVFDIILRILLLQKR
jgi:lipid A 3-O-deacylase